MAPRRSSPNGRVPWPESDHWIPLIFIVWSKILDISCLYFLGLNLPEKYSYRPRPWVAASWRASDQCVKCSFSFLVTLVLEKGPAASLERAVREAGFFNRPFHLASASTLGCRAAWKSWICVGKCGASIAAPRHLTHLTIESKWSQKTMRMTDGFKDMLCHATKYHCHCPSRPLCWAKISKG